MTEKGEARSREAIAETLCSMHFTDGFCMPRHDAECRCNKLAAACLVTIETRGVELVWPPHTNPERGTP